MSYLFRSLTVGAGLCTIFTACFASIYLEQGSRSLIIAGAFIGGVLLSLFGPPLLAKRLSKRHATFIGMGLVIALSLAGLIWAISFSSMQVSDFGVHYRCGIQAVGGISEQIERCQGEYMAPNLVYWSRSLLYTIPLGVIFGDTPKAFDIANALYHALALSLLFFVVRRSFSVLAAAIAVFSWGLLPERIYAITLATPDNLVAVLIIGMLLLYNEELTPLRVVALSLLLIGISFLRTTGPLYALALFITVLSTPDGLTSRRNWAVIGSILLFFGFYSLFMWALPVSYPIGGVLKKFSGLDITSTQDYYVGHRWEDHVWPAIPKAEQTSMALTTLAIEVAHHAKEYPSYILNKASDLFAGSGYMFFATANLDYNADTVVTVKQSTVPTLNNASLIHRAVTVFIAAMALTGIIRGKREQLLLTAISITAITFTLFFLFYETQPRYIFMPGITLAILAASAWAPADRLDTIANLKECGTGILGIGLLIGIFALSANLLRYQLPVPLRAATIASSPTCPETTATLSPDILRTRIEFPQGASCATVSIPLGNRVRAVRFLITRDTFPFPYEQVIDNGLSWTITTPDGTIQDGQFGLSAARWYRYDIMPKDQAEALSFTFFRSSASVPQALEIANLVVTHE